MGKLQELQKQFRRDLANREGAVFNALAQGFEEAYKGVQYRLDALLLAMKTARDGGEEVSVGWLMRYDRLRALETQARAAMQFYSQEARGRVLTAQRGEVVRGEADAQGLTEGAVASVSGSWNRLPTGAIREMVGSTLEGSPFQELFAGWGEGAAKSVRTSLLTGLAAGENPTKVARRVRDGVGMALPKAQTIARTEMLRSYRGAAIESYRANSDVVRGWVWVASQSSRSCPVCISLSGTVHSLDEEFSTHINCRCSASPFVNGVNYGKTGEQWFSEQDEEVQDSILGKAAAAAYRNGEVKLADFAGVKMSDKWGETRYTKSLREAQGGSKPQKDSVTMPKKEN